MQMEPFSGSTGKTIFRTLPVFGKSSFSNRGILVIRFFKHDMQRLACTSAMTVISLMAQEFLDLMARKSSITLLQRLPAYHNICGNSNNLHTQLLTGILWDVLTG